MKKYLLLFLMCVYASIGAWASATITNNKHLNGDQYAATAIRIVTTNAGDINSASLSDAHDWANMIFVSGPVNEDDIKKLNTTYGSYVKIINLTQATGLEASWLTNLTGSTIEGIGLPDGMALNVSNENVKVVYSSNFTGAKNNIAEDKGDNEIDVYVQKAGGITTLNMLQNLYLLQYRTINLAGATGTINTSAQEYLDLSGTQSITINRISNDPYSVSGCDVTINMTKAEAGQTLADLIATAKAAVIAGGKTGICTLTVTGPVTNNDLIALGGTNMTDATRIDLSNATLGSGVTIENIQLPTSLTSLILPKGLTVSVGLKSKLTAATNLQYAYSPSTGTTGVSPDTETISVADYVWVNSTGGLDLALTNESTLNNSKYVKVASDVALSATDITFNTAGRLPNVKYFDMRNANMDASLAAVSFKSPNSTDYRIILPDNWSTDQMSAFASHLGDVFWTMAAIYSYSGTTLKIYEATDTKYMPTALSNHRIVVDGTTAVEVVGSTLGTYLLAALNGADSDVKTITISASTINNLTFDNDNITTLNVTGLNLNTAEINVDGCAVLKNLNVTGSTIKSVDASATSLEAVNLNGSTISNNVDLSGSGLKTLTTNSNTWIQGDLHLESTASFTSFASTAKFGVNNATNGNIYLNASGVSTVDLQSVQFQNTSSMIHIDSTVGEGDTPLTNLNADGQLTIYIPTGFEKATRLHPYSTTLDDNIAELAGNGAFEDGCDPKCRIEYNADTHVATVYCYTPGHFKDLMENDNNYGKFVDGAIFTFDASCKLNAEDLAALAGKDGYGNFNWNYVDLYNLPASYEHESVTYTYDNIITEAINTLRTKNWQYKGLLLPKTTNLGTTLIQDRTEDETKVATCSQFIAYSGAIGTSALTAAYIYKAADDWGITHAERLGKMKAVMDLHSEIMNTTTNWSVSTNSPTPIDMSILPTSVTIEGNTVNTSKLETVNNDMVAGTGKPSIYAYPAYENVMYTVATSTGIGNTPNLEILKVTGPVNAADIESVNQFTGGPRVLDLSATTGGITKAMLESITNDDIEYIILPEGMSKDVVCGANYTSGLKTNLKAVISSSNTNLVAYVNKAGSLAEARYLATGGSVDANTGLITPAQTGLQSVTLAGNLNAGDIAANTAGKKVGDDGHWVTGATNAANIALSSEQGTITTVDLKNAVFATHDDMNFSNAGLSSMTHVDLPTAASMNEIPEGCFRGIASLTEVCIPYNYEYIYNGVFVDSYVGHITTTDSNGALIDNGPQTITLSANLKQLGSAENDGDALTECVFAQNRRVADMYVLATKVPKCYINTFPADMCYGWGGFEGGNVVYSREKYKNGENLFTVFHFPSEESYNAVTDASKKQDSYANMKKLYTDVNKVYSMKEQSGAVDSNGDPILWPTFSELRRVYNQATNGMTWNDWTVTYDSNREVNGGDQIPTTTQPTGSGEGDYDFAGYGGWHQLTLSLATYVEPDETVVNEKIVREYQETDEWYTFCIPYSITVEQLHRILGVPASTESVHVKLYKKDGTTLVNDSVTAGINPEVRTLNGVIRKPGNGSTNTVTFMFTQPLVQANSNEYKYFNINDAAPNSSAPAANGNTKTSNKPIAIRGGLPFIVKPYKLKGTTIKNLGKYVMERFSDEFVEEQACGNLGYDFYEQLGTREKKTSRFVKPYEKHKIQALLDNGGSTSYTTHSNGKKYYYAFIGTFWEQDLPKNSFYVTGGKWYRYSSGTKNYKWAPYKCIIMCSQELNDSINTVLNHDTFTSGKYRSLERSNCPKVVKELADDDVFDSAFKLGFADGLDDSDFNEAAGAKYIFSLDEMITEYDENGNETTSIKTLDGVDITPMPDNVRVYNMSGQYVGNSLEGLPKGLYIANGKKFIVR